MKKSKFWLFNVQYNEPARSVEQNKKNYIGSVVDNYNIYYS